MKSSLIQLAVLAALGVTAQAQATGLVAVPAAGFTSSAYTDCYNAGRTSTDVKGNFGSTTFTAPTTTSNNTCAVFPTNDATSPVSGYTLVTSATRTVFSGTTQIGSLVDRVWRDSATSTSCIYGARWTAINAPVPTTTVSGTASKNVEFNDLARGGWGSGSVNAGYFFHPSSNDSPVFRLGRTFTSVQHRALQYDTAANKALNGTNYLDSPTIGGSTTLAINGENTPIASTTAASTVAANQTAQVNSNWIDFTLDSGWADDDGGSNALSAMVYVQAACTSAAPTTLAGAIRLRQTAQEDTVFSEISVDGFVPAGASIP